MFVGYPGNHAHDVFRLVNLQTNRIVLSRDVQWLNVKWTEHKNIRRSTTIMEEEIDEEDVDEEEENQSVGVSTANNNENVSVTDVGRENDGDEV